MRNIASVSGDLFLDFSGFDFFLFDSLGVQYFFPFYVVFFLSVDRLFSSVVLSVSSLFDSSSELVL